MWITVIALVSAALGWVAGWAQTPPQDKSVHSAGTFDHCPHAKTVTATLTTTVGVSGDNTVEPASDLHVTMTGVNPAQPPPSDKLQRPEGEHDFAACFVATDADIASLNWADGKLDTDLKFVWDSVKGSTNQLVKTTYVPDHSALTIDPCARHEDWDKGAICQDGVKNTVIIRVTLPVRIVVSDPFPDQVARTDNYLENTWQFNGAIPLLSLMLDAPRQVAATSWLSSDQGRNAKLPHTGGAVTVDLQALTGGASEIWLAAVVAALFLRRERAATRRPAPSLVLLLVVLAGIVLCFRLSGLGPLEQYQADGVVVVVAWAILSAAAGSAAFGPKRALAVTTVVSIAALGAICVLVISVPTRPLAVPLFIVFSVALVALVIFAACALWDQISGLFVLTDYKRNGSIWYRVYDRVIDGTIIAAFMFAIGFPVGKGVTYAAGSGMEAYSTEPQLVSAIGDYIFVPVVWATLLLILSYLARFLVCMPSKNIGSSAVSVIALMLCLAAPWANGLSIDAPVAIPIWLLQFGVLWIAFRRLSIADTPNGGRVRIPTELLEAARDGAPTKPATASPSEQEGAAGSPQSPPDEEPRTRLLSLPSRNDRLGNAQAAARIASVIAIVPVAYFVQTTLAEFRSQLHTSTGVVVVAISGVRELVLWVVSGFIFGYVYSKLPGRIGPIKALAFAAIWIASCIGSFLVAQSLGPDVTQTDWTHVTIYRSAQFALFAIVLGILLDLKTVMAEGGTWRDLRNLYDLRNYGEIAAAVAPAALLVVTLWQQIAAGSGFDAAKALLNSFPGILK